MYIIIGILKYGAWSKFSKSVSVEKYFFQKYEGYKNSFFMKETKII